MGQALGFIETRGLTASVEALDAMVKTADVSVVCKVHVGGGLVTVVVSGDVASVKAALDAGAIAANSMGELLSIHVIPRPHEDLANILPLKADIKTSVEIIKNPVEKPRSSKNLIKDEDPSMGSEVKVKKGKKTEKSEKVLTPKDLNRIFKKEGIKKAMEEVEKLTVVELRKFARTFKDLSIAGREISKANKVLLLEEIRRHYERG